MTKLTVYDREIGTPELVFRSRRDIRLGTEAPAALDSLGRQLEQMGTEVARRVKAAEQTVEYGKIIADAKREMATFYSGRSRLYDEYGTLTEDTNNHFNEMRKQLVKGIKDVDQQTRVLQGLESIGTQYHAQAVSDASKQAVESVKTEQVRTRASMIQEAARGNDDQMSTVMVNYANMQRSLVAAGIYDSSDAEDEILDFANDAVRGRVRFLMNTNPYEAQDYLTDQSTFSRLLKPENRENLLAQTDRLIRQKEEREERERRRIEKMREEADKQERDALYQKSVYEIRNNELTLETLDKRMRAGLYNKTDYDTLYKIWLNRNEDFIGNPEIYKEFKDRVYMGELDQRSVMAALADEQISNKWADELLDDIAAGAGIVQTEEYKTYLGALRTKLGYTPAGNMDNSQMQLIGNATIEFRRRAIAGENLQDLYDDLSVRFSKSFREMVEKPRFKTYGEAKDALGPGPALDRELMLQKVFYERMSQNQGTSNE